MPTGYTAKLMEKGQDFRSFVLLCARGMGACIMQRDDPMDDLPKKQKPHDYHSKAIKETEKLFAKLKAMTPAEQREHGQRLREEAIARAVQSHTKAQEEEARLESMEAQVKAWQPPTKDHDGLKNFMLQQLGISKNDGRMEKYVKEAEGKTAEAYFAEAVSTAARGLNYHTEEQAKEIERTNERNKWIDQLYKSLP